MQLKAMWRPVQCVKHLRHRCLSQRYWTMRGEVTIAEHYAAHSGGLSGGGETEGDLDYEFHGNDNFEMDDVLR